ncbi:unnamed protein product [Ectocarpus sp. 12 AP-2014]
MRNNTLCMTPWSSCVPERRGVSRATAIFHTSSLALRSVILVITVRLPFLSQKSQPVHARGIRPVLLRVSPGNTPHGCIGSWSVDAGAKKVAEGTASALRPIR